MKKIISYRWLWQSDLRHPDEFFGRWMLIRGLPSAVKNHYTKRMKKSNKIIAAFMTFVAVLIYLFAMVLEVLQFVVYYSLLPFQIFSEWFCDLGNNF